MASIAIIPQINDVLFGKGPAILQHPGNQHFRAVVDSYKQKFLEAHTRKKKRAMAEAIVGEIHKLGGRFLIEEKKGNCGNKGGTNSANSNVHKKILEKVWVSVGEEKIMTKVMHRLREKTNHPSQQEKSEPHPPENYDSIEIDFDFDQLLDECDKDNEKLNPFLGDFSPHHDEDSNEHIVYEGTLQQWTERSKQKFNANVLRYVESALPIALKLTECLIEAEKDEQRGNGNPVPLASIAAANVLVRAKEIDTKESTDERSERKELVDYVSIMSCVGDSPDSGGAISRLSALGFVLYELFAGEEPQFEGGTPNADTLNLMSLDSINLNNNEERTIQPRKKSQRSGSLHSKCIATLNCVGIPQSLCALLMLEKPSIFLINLSVSPLPSLLISDKLYGRENEKHRLSESFKQNIDGNCRGVIITGKAGVGKSRLALYVRTLANKVNGYFIPAKFDQTQDLYPFATVGSLFNSLCDVLVRDATEAQLKVINGELESALGVQAGLLLGICPSLAKLMPSCLKLGIWNCIDAFMSMQFLLRELLRVVSPHSRRIVFFLDDLHWADSMSLRLIGSLMSSNDGNKPVFYMCSYRDNEVNENWQFNQWLSLVSMLCLENIKLENMSVDSVNQLLSDSLHSSPRITRPLSSVLHQKAGHGNPFFLVQIIESLKDKGYIYFDMSFPKWSWDMDKILELELCDNVVSLLVEEMYKLDEDLQYGLKVASCIGSSVKSSILDILSRDTGKNLHDILHRISQKGFINFDGTTYSWLHDKVQQAAYYELMPEQERHRNNMRFGLAICSYLFDNKAKNNMSANALNLSSDSQELNSGGVENDDLFFLAVNQINRGGCNVLEDSNQKLMIAALNLEAGNRSIELLDFSAALKLFEHGISFLDDEQRWKNNAVCLDLFNAAIETACSLNDAATVKRLSKEVLANTENNDDKLTSLYAGVKSLRMEFKFVEAKKLAFTVLEKLGERLPRPLNDVGLAADIKGVKMVLQNMSDDSIMNLHKTNHKKKDLILMNLYNDLSILLGMIDPKLVSDTHLRMAQISLSNGLCPMSPVAFASFAILLVQFEEYTLAYRLVTLSLRLVDKINAQRYKPSVISAVAFVSWIAEPFQSIGETLFLGYKLGLRNVFSNKIILFSNKIIHSQKSIGSCGRCLETLPLKNGICSGGCASLCKFRNGNAEVCEKPRASRYQYCQRHRRKEYREMDM